MKVIFTVSLLSLCSLLLTIGSSYGQYFAPTIAVSWNNQAIDRLVVSKADTVQIRVSCLSECPVVAESNNIKITPIGKGSFIFVPRLVGRHEVKVCTSCPEGTSITMGLQDGRIRKVPHWTLAGVGSTGKANLWEAYFHSIIQLKLFTSHPLLLGNILLADFARKYRNGMVC